MICLWKVTGSAAQKKILQIQFLWPNIFLLFYVVFSGLCQLLHSLTSALPTHMSLELWHIFDVSESQGTITSSGHHFQRYWDTFWFGFLIISTSLPAVRPCLSTTWASAVLLNILVLFQCPSTNKTLAHLNLSLFFPRKWLKIAAIMGKGRGGRGELFCVYHYYLVDIFVTSFRD